MGATWGAVALLVFGLGVIGISCIGMALLHDPLDRLHLVTPASTIGVIATSASIILRQGFSASGTAALLAAAVIAIGSPFVSHAVARSIVIRRRYEHPEHTKSS
ncbi:MAG: monovalent cation/H(+) antiporter subunit G [Acidimicrobiales bacterium]